MGIPFSDLRPTIYLDNIVKGFGYLKKCEERQSIQNNHIKYIIQSHVIKYHIIKSVYRDTIELNRTILDIQCISKLLKK